MRTLNEHYGSWHNSNLQYFLNDPHFDIKVIIHYYWVKVMSVWWDLLFNIGWEKRRWRRRHK